MTDDVDPPEVDWLARKSGGVIDFRLPNDPHLLSTDEISRRQAEYLRQCWDQMRADRAAREAEARARQADERGPAFAGIAYRSEDWAHYLTVTHDDDGEPEP